MATLTLVFLGTILLQAQLIQGAQYRGAEGPFLFSCSCGSILIRLFINRSSLLGRKVPQLLWSETKSNRHWHVHRQGPTLGQDSVQPRILQHLDRTVSQHGGLGLVTNWPLAPLSVTIVWSFFSSLRCRSGKEWSAKHDWRHFGTGDLCLWSISLPLGSRWLFWLGTHHWLQKVKLFSSVSAWITCRFHSYPLELHLVHHNKKYGTLEEAVSKEDGLAVIGVLFYIGGISNENNNVIGSRHVGFTHAHNLFDQLSPVRKSLDGCRQSLDLNLQWACPKWDWLISLTLKWNPTSLTKDLWPHQAAKNLSDGLSLEKLYLSLKVK